DLAEVVEIEHEQAKPAPVALGTAPFLGESLLEREAGRDSGEGVDGIWTLESRHGHPPTSSTAPGTPLAPGRTIVDVPSRRSRPSSAACAFSSCSCVPEPATRKRTSPSSAITVGIASSAIWKPFS